MINQQNKITSIDINEETLFQYSAEILDILLKDRTTGNNIRWGTDDYSQYGHAYFVDREITPILIIGRGTEIIQPRIAKAQTEQTKRTREAAEVFTPSWICNAQNNLVDEAWFGRKNVFNIEKEKSWQTNKEKICFPTESGKTWQEYVDAKRLEITCGEAPYLVSRYDTVTGKAIPLEERIGLLDRKLRVINENAEDEKERLKWMIRAFESIYGYDLQGDNVLLARENLLYTFIDYYKAGFGKDPEEKNIRKIATIISWNIWQMNGLTMTAPYSEAENHFEQLSMFAVGEETKQSEEMPCIITDWRAKTKLEFKSLLKG